MEQKIKRIVIDQNKLKQTYGEDIEQFFLTGPVEEVIQMDLDKFNKIYGDCESKRSAFEL